ncbi:GANP/Nin1/mts3/eIF-3 p25 family protein [Verticillium dahliae]|nr:GANP/Nin1/mts3/eIF-3 p25 family protein [Verticillium dahliae]
MAPLARELQFQVLQHPASSRKSHRVTSNRSSPTTASTHQHHHPTFGRRSPKPRIFGALAPSAADIAEPSITGLDGAGDVRWAKRNRTTTQRDTMNGFGAKRRAGSPADGASSDDGRKRKGNGALDRRKKVTTTNGKNANTSKPRPSNVTAFGTDTTDYDTDPGTYDTEANSTYAKRIYDQLRKDRILPPKWPSDPGNPASKGAMAKYRETSKSYRDRGRASLMAAGLIDDPDKPKRLEDAIDFKGICEDMCPNFEKITRITEFDVQQAEKDSQTSFPVISKMVKKLARSAAGQEAPLPMDVRSTAALRRTLDYLVDDLLEDEDNLPVLHGYLWDRTRAIRRDFIFHSSMSAEEMKDQVYCLETIARFHVTSLHLLSRPDVTPEDFSEQQEIEQLGKALLSLMHAYDDSKAQGLVCENETEFRAYQLLFSANQPNILDNVQQEWANPRLWKDSDEIRTAVSLVEALQSTTDLHGPMGTAPHLAVSGAYNTYFKIVENPEVSYTMACFAEIHFGQLRRSMLKTLRRAYWRPKVLARDITPALLNTFLRFDTEDEAIDFVEEHGMSWVPLEDSPDDEYRQYLRTTDGMEFPRLHHTTSETIVEKKRGSRSLSEVIHRSVYEDPSATAASNRSGTEKPFLRSTAKSQSTPNASALQGFQKLTNGFATTQPTETPFSQVSSNGFAKTNGGTTTSPFSTPSFGQPSSTTPSPFQTTSSQPAARSPFASLGAATGQKPPPQPSAFSSPFASTPQLAGGSSSEKPSPFASPFAQSAATVQKAKETPTIPSPFSAFGKPTEVSAPAAVDASTKLPHSAASPFSSPFSQAPATTQQPSLSSESSSPFAGLSKTVGKPTSPFAAPPAGADQSKPVPSADEGQSISGQSKFPTLSGTAATLETPQLSFPPPTGTTGTPKTTTSSPFSFPPTTSTGVAVPPAATLSPGKTVSPFPSVTSPPPITPAIPQDAAIKQKISEAPKSLTSTLPAGPQQSILGGSTSTTPPGTAAAFPATVAATPTSAAVSAPSQPAAPPAPKRDLMADFTNWFVKGDEGLLQEFEVYMVEQIVKKTYDEFVKEEAERKRREEEERDLAEARKFQVYNLSVKFFYRWREIARKNRLHRRRVRDREEYKAALAEKFAAEAARKKKAKQVEAARLAALQRSKGIDPVDEFRDLLQMQKDKSQDHEDALWASGILAGIHDEREAIASIVRHHMPPPAAPTPKKWKKSLPPSNVSISRSESAKPGSAKTQALREKFSASTNNRSTSFRRSLPSSTGSSSFRASPSPSEPSKRQSRVSDRWRLKAMGLVTMPDGTALPESLANSMRYDGARYDGWGSFGLDSKTHHRSRSTSADVGAAAAARERFSQSFHNRSASEAKGPRGASPTTIKRKRSVDDEQSTAVDSDTKKRKAAGNADLEQILRDAKETLSALRSSRMELDEGAGWFREQSEMMQQEEALSRRSSSAWGERL